MRRSTAALLLAAAALVAGCERTPRPDPSARLASWPWPAARPMPLWPGVSYRTATAFTEGHAVHLLEFDFAARPSLRLALYDQDQDDASPFDNRADCRRGVTGVARHLEATARGPVVAAWNGLFYNLAADGTGSHIAPVVLDGRVHYNVGNHRWTVGVAERGGRPVLGLVHLPDKAALAARFDFAAAGAQALVRDGLPLRLLPQPRPDEPRLPRPYPSTPHDAGPIPDIDYLHVSRTSMGWSADAKKLWVLVVRELQPSGGWTLAELQRFWVSFGAANAVNLDGGPETQLLWHQPAGWRLVPSGKSRAEESMVDAPDVEHDPGGGSLMTWYVRDTAEDTP